MGGEYERRVIQASIESPLSKWLRLCNLVICAVSMRGDEKLGDYWIYEVEQISMLELSPYIAKQKIQKHSMWTRVRGTSSAKLLVGFCRRPVKRYNHIACTVSPPGKSGWDGAWPPFKFIFAPRPSCR